MTGDGSPTVSSDAQSTPRFNATIQELRDSLSYFVDALAEHKERLNCDACNEELESARLLLVRQSPLEVCDE